MLIDARLKQEELKIKLIQAFDDPTKEGYFLDNEDPTVDFNNMSTARNARAYASVNKAGEVIGYISYAYEVATRRFYGIGAINFTDDKLTFASDLLTLFRRAFAQKNALTIEFKAVSDNPACAQYERFIKRVHGELVGVLHDYVMMPDGKLHDMSIYEVRRHDYLNKNDIDVVNTKPIKSDKSKSSTRAHNGPKSALDSAYVRTSKMHAHQLCATIERERSRFIIYHNPDQPIPYLPETGWGYISDEYVYINDCCFERVLNASGIGASKTMKSRVLNTLIDAGVFCAGPRSDKTCPLHLTRIGNNFHSSEFVYMFKRGPEFDAFVRYE